MIGNGASGGDSAGVDFNACYNISLFSTQIFVGSSGEGGSGGAAGQGNQTTANGGGGGSSGSTIGLIFYKTPLIAINNCTIDVTGASSGGDGGAGADCLEGEGSRGNPAGSGRNTIGMIVRDCRNTTIQDSQISIGSGGDAGHGRQGGVGETGGGKGGDGGFGGFCYGIELTQGTADVLMERTAVTIGSSGSGGNGGSGGSSSGIAGVGGRGRLPGRAAGVYCPSCFNVSMSEVSILTQGGGFSGAGGQGGNGTAPGSGGEVSNPFHLLVGAFFDSAMGITISDSNIFAGNGMDVLSGGSGGLYNDGTFSDGVGGTDGGGSTAVHFSSSTNLVVENCHLTTTRGGNGGAAGEAVVDVGGSGGDAIGILAASSPVVNTGNTIVTGPGGMGGLGLNGNAPDGASIDVLTI